MFRGRIRAKNVNGETAPAARGLWSAACPERSRSAACRRSEPRSLLRDTQLLGDTSTIRLVPLQHSPFDHYRSTPRQVGAANSGGKPPHSTGGGH